MALVEDMVLGWGSGALLGVGAVVVAPAVLPKVGALLRPVAKGFIKGYFALTEVLGGGGTGTEPAAAPRATQVQPTRHPRAQSTRRAQTKKTRSHPKRQAPGRARTA
jgi:hypothetical protein